jgi:hypothetical protein
MRLGGVKAFGMRCFDPSGRSPTKVRPKAPPMFPAGRLRDGPGFLFRSDLWVTVAHRFVRQFSAKLNSMVNWHSKWSSKEIILETKFRLTGGNPLTLSGRNSTTPRNFELYDRVHAHQTARLRAAVHGSPHPPDGAIGASPTL